MSAPPLEIRMISRNSSSRIKKYHVNAVGVTADVSKKSGAAKIVSDAKKKLGGVDAVVCVAGYPMLPDLWNKSMQDLIFGDILNVFEVDVLGSFLVIKEALPIMVKQKRGVISSFLIYSCNFGI